MSKARETKNLEQRRTSGPLLAISLAASLAAFGCTTNHNLGNGTPTRSGPDVRTAPTSGVTSGSEGETPVLPPPMTSATLAPATAVSRADAAAAIMAQHQPSRGRYLGVVNPGPAGRGYASDGRVTGQLVPPALLANPQLTVNPSISSDGVAVVNSGDALATTTTGAATALPAGTFASGGTTLPTAASAGIPTVTGAGALATTPLAATAGTIAPTAVAGGSTLPATASAAIPTVTGASGVGVQIVRGTNGAATITNTTATSTAPAPATTNTTSGNQ